jgi:hypothetical protein
VRVVASEKTVIPEEITVNIDFAEMGESDKKVTVGSILRRGRGCCDTRTTSSYARAGMLSKAGERWRSSKESGQLVSSGRRSMWMTV